jgi:hypothetical protein
MRFSALASLAVLLAPVLAMPLEARSETSQKLTQELSSLTQASSLLQIWSQNGGAAMNEQEYGARWADFNSATAQVADNVAGAAPLSADDMEEVNGAFETVRKGGGWGLVAVICRGRRPAVVSPSRRRRLRRPGRGARWDV